MAYLTRNFVVPANCTNLTITVWGAGGTGGGDGASGANGSNGGQSTANTTLVAGGGAGGQSASTGTKGIGGTASGGDVNQVGGDGGNGVTGTSGAGGTAFLGGTGGASATAGNTGNPGGNPGGGGGGAFAGGGLTGGGGGAGAYVKKTFTVTAGQSIPYTVGRGGSNVNMGGLAGEGAVVMETSGTAFSGDCTNGNPVPGSVCTGGAIYVGTFSGAKYMTTPPGCNNSATPTCNGTVDTLKLTWGANSVVTNVTSTTNGAGNTTTLAANYGDTAAAKFCENMVYAGYSDWFLPAVDEATFLLSASVHPYISGIIDNGTNCYLSSTENTSTQAKAGMIEWVSGVCAYTKTSAAWVRCMRKF